MIAGRIVSGLSLLCLAGLVALPVLAQPPAASVLSAEVVKRDIAPAYWASGSVLSPLDGYIAAEVAGPVLWVAEVGDRIEQGQPLARLDTQNLLIRQGLDRAEIGQLEAEADYQTKQMGRLKSLADRNNAAQAELDRLISESDNTKQQLHAARLRLQQTELDLRRAEVPAPYTGVISARSARPGGYISAGTDIVRLVNMEKLEASVRAPAITLRYNRPGDKVVVTADHGDYTATVRELVPVADAVSRMIELRISLPIGDWVVGEPVRVSLAQGEPRELTTVPRDALVLRANETYVVRVNADSKAEKILVRAGYGGEQYIAVEGDLQPGDRVVIRGAERLRPGQQVMEM